MSIATKRGDKARSGLGWRHPGVSESGSSRGVLRLRPMSSTHISWVLPAALSQNKRSQSGPKISSERSSRYPRSPRHLESKNKLPVISAEDVEIS